jgi:hypothetical protein
MELIVPPDAAFLTVDRDGEQRASKTHRQKNGGPWNIFSSN